MFNSAQSGLSGNDSVRDRVDGNKPGGRTRGRNSNGLLNYFNMQMKKINFEVCNKQTRKAIGGPSASASFSSMTSSIIEGDKCDQLLGLVDSVLRRNREGDSDEDGVNIT